MLRGNAGQDIFFGPDDRYRLCQLLQEGPERFDYRVHGFCLMTNTPASGDAGRRQTVSAMYAELELSLHSLGK